VLLVLAEFLKHTLELHKKKIVTLKKEQL
jgi:hypothetical protein